MLDPARQAGWLRDQDHAFVDQIRPSRPAARSMSVRARQWPPPRSSATVASDSIDFIDEMMQGAFFALFKQVATPACANATNISTKSEPEIEKNGTFRFAGDRASQQGSYPFRRPDQQHALECRPPASGIFADLQDSIISCSSSFASSVPHVLEVTFFCCAKAVLPGIFQAQRFVAASLHLLIRTQADRPAAAMATHSAE